MTEAEFQSRRVPNGPCNGSDLWEGGIPVLYHYERFVPEHLIGTLRDQKIHCSNPANVNDPWDCKPWFDTEKLQSDPELIEDTLRVLRSTSTLDLLLHPLHAEFERRARTDQAFLKNLIDGFSKQLTQILGRRRLYCLTPYPNKILMWSHYAANHTGICLEFGVNNPLFSLARPVHYHHTYPTFHMSTVYNDVLPLMFTKAMEWCYEREFRLIANDKDSPLKLDGDFLKLPEGALVAVILGAECEHAEEIISIVQQYMPALQIKRAVRKPNEYKLTISAYDLSSSPTSL